MIRSNQAPYITKAYRKTVMKRFELKTKYLKILENFNKFRKQKIFCSRLYKKERKKFLDKLYIDIKLVALTTKKFGLLLNHFLAIKFPNLLNLLLLKAIK